MKNIKVLYFNQNAKTIIVVAFGVGKNDFINKLIKTKEGIAKITHATFVSSIQSDIDEGGYVLHFEMLDENIENIHDAVNDDEVNFDYYFKKGEF